MIRLFFTSAFLLFTLSAATAKYNPAKLYFINGDVKEGLVKAFDFADKVIIYKSNKDADKEEIPSDALKTLEFNFEDGSHVIYDRLKTCRYTKKGDIKVRDAVWLPVIQRGLVTLYGATTAGTVRHSAKGASINPGDSHFYVHREGEDGAMWIHFVMHTTIKAYNQNRMFQFVGVKYFSDNQELSEQIRDEVYTYKQLIEVVDSYNKWAKTKGKS